MGMFRHCFDHNAYIHHLDTIISTCRYHHYYTVACGNFRVQVCMGVEVNPIVKVALCAKPDRELP